VDLLLEGSRVAWRGIVSGDPDVYHPLLVSVVCTALSVGLAYAAAVPFGTWLALRKPPGYRPLVFLLRLGMFVPTVTIGVLVFMLLSRRGFLGGLDLLYTKSAVVLGLAVLAFPLLAALAHGAAADQDPVVVETARTLGAGRWRTLVTVLGESRSTLTAATLLATARCLTEVGIATTVGGSIRWRTRTLPSAVQLELSKGDFAAAFAPNLVLFVLAMGIAVVAIRLEKRASAS
jgi:tungstate transport system permease protein